MDRPNLPFPHSGAKLVASVRALDDSGCIGKYFFNPQDGRGRVGTEVGNPGVVCDQTPSGTTSLVTVDRGVSFQDGIL